MPRFISEYTSSHYDHEDLRASRLLRVAEAMKVIHTLPNQRDINEVTRDARIRYAMAGLHTLARVAKAPAALPVAIPAQEQTVQEMAENAGLVVVSELADEAA